MPTNDSTAIRHFVLRVNIVKEDSHTFPRTVARPPFSTHFIMPRQLRRRLCSARMMAMHRLQDTANLVTADEEVQCPEIVQICKYRWLDAIYPCVLSCASAKLSDHSVEWLQSSRISSKIKDLAQATSPSSDRKS